MNDAEKSLEEPTQITSFSDACSLSAGAVIAFTMATSAGNARLCVPSADLGNILQFFATCASAVADDVGAQGRPLWPPVNDLVPIPATGIGFQAGSTPDTMLLVMNLSGFAMAFEIPKSDLADMAEQLSQVARTLSASAHRSN